MSELNTSGLSEDQAENMREVNADLQAASDKFQKSMDEGGFGVVSAVGEYITDISHAVGNFGDGLGDTLEDSVAKGFGTEGFGTSFLGEFGEASFAVIGEATETITEAVAGVGEAAGVAVGGVIENVGDIGENLWDAGGNLLSGDFGEAAESVGAAVKDVVDIAGVAVDFGVAGVKAAGEVVEGVFETGWEVVEGVGEMAVGLGSDIADLGEGLVDGIGDVLDDIF